MAAPRDARSCTIFADDAPISITNTLPSFEPPKAEENFSTRPPSENAIMTQVYHPVWQQGVPDGHILLDRVYFCGEDELILRHTLDSVRRELDGNLSPRNHEVGVVILRFGDVGNRIRELHRFGEIVELEFFRYPAGVAAQGPAFELRHERLRLLTGERRRAAFAGNAAFF